MLIWMLACTGPGETHEGAGDVAECYDGFDNDLDGAPDCEDPDCQELRDCSSGGDADTDVDRDSGEADVDTDVDADTDADPGDSGEANRDSGFWTYGYRGEHDGEMTGFFEFWAEGSRQELCTTQFGMTGVEPLTSCSQCDFAWSVEYDDGQVISGEECGSLFGLYDGFPSEDFFGVLDAWGFASAYDGYGSVVTVRYNNTWYPWAYGYWDGETLSWERWSGYYGYY